MGMICIISKITYWPACIQVNRSVQSFVLHTVNHFKIAQRTFRFYSICDDVPVAKLKQHPIDVKYVSPK